MKAAKKQLIEATQAVGATKGPGLPWASFGAPTAPGPSGERYEHLQDCMASRDFASRRRLKRALDRLTTAEAAGTLPTGARWLLDTSLMWPSKEKAGKEVVTLEDEWLGEDSEGPSDGQGDGGDDQGAEAVGGEGPCPGASSPGGVGEPVEAQGEGRAAAVAAGRPAAPPAVRPKVRPIQMGGFLRKHARKRLLAIDKNVTQAATLDMRQFGCGAPGGAEAIIHFRKAVMALWQQKLLLGPVCIIDIDHENFFGSLE